MLDALARFCLAFVLAIGMAGEAAFALGSCQHGPSLAQAEPTVASGPAAAPCHNGADHAATLASAKSPVAGDAPDQTPGLALCECAALLKSCSPSAAATAARIDHRRFAPPGATAYLSHDPEPDRPPPRA